jgi:hypothetical protein
VFVTNVDAVSKDDAWSVRVEAVGTKAISPRELERIEQAVSSRLKKPTKIYLWFKGEVMITDQGYSSVEEFTRKRLAEKAARGRPGKPPGMVEKE